MTKRIYSLDVLRGVPIVIMLFLDAPPDKLFAILHHAPWAGLTVPDVALPAFAFAMGAAAAISFSRREPTMKKILRRTAFMFAIGVFLNVLPKFYALVLVNGFGLSHFVDGSIIHGRLFGIIQRLAVTYALGSFIALTVKSKLNIFIAAFVLAAVSSAGFHLYAPDNPFDEARNISRAVDFLFPGANHIYTPTHDPEGIYGCIAGTSSVLFGFVAGKLLLIENSPRNKIFLLTAAGLVTLIAGGLWTNFDIVSKKLWTTPFTLLNAGGDFIFLALLVKFVDGEDSFAKKIFQPFAALGTNPLFFFVADYIAVATLVTIPVGGGGANVYWWLYWHTTQGVLSPEIGATLFCVLWCLLWLPLAEFFYRRGITIKI